MGPRKADKKPPKVKFATAGGETVSAKDVGDKRKGKKQSQQKEATTKKKKKKKDKHEAVSEDAVKVVRRQLAAAGCKLWEVEADGNCLFRAISDQLFGDQHQHLDIRKAHRDDFEPFMEDEEKFDHYCARMREDGTWGGNQELYAAARLFQVYVVVHMESSRMVIECDALEPKRVLHVAYHGSDHYDSVRSLKESDEQARNGAPPMEIALDCDGFRPDDLAKRWRARGGNSADQQRITAEVGAEGGVGASASANVDASLASQLRELELHTASGSSLSKKAQRQLRRQASKRSGAKSKLK